MSTMLVIGMFASVCLMLLSGFPVAFTLAGASLIFAGIAYMLGAFDPAFLAFFPNRIYGIMLNEVLVAVPLFVFMGVMLERSRVAEELLETMAGLFGRMKGGLGVSVCLVGALLAASTGIVGATVVTMGLLSLPTMLKRGYDPAHACGTICASGTLGQIIPPSIVLVVLGDQISSAYQEAQRNVGNFAPEPISVGDLFAGALIPGLGLFALYILYQIFIAISKPAWVPAMVVAQKNTDLFTWKLVNRIATILLAPLLLIVAVLGSILAGIATPTEAAAVGAVGAIFLGGLRLGSENQWPIYAAAVALLVILLLTLSVDLRIGRDVIRTGEYLAIIAAGAAMVMVACGIIVALIRLRASGALGEVMRSTMQISAMVFAIVIGAQLFSLVFRGINGDDFVRSFFLDLPGGAFGAMLVVMLVMFFLGFFLDFIEITFVVVPIVAPILLQLDLHPVWLGVMIALNLQTSFLTPPFGFALFYLRGVAPRTVTTGQIYRGVAPFVVLQLTALVLLALFPGLATWLPDVIFR